MLHLFRKIFCMHIYEYEQMEEIGTHKECRKCGDTKQQKVSVSSLFLQRISVQEKCVKLGLTLKVFCFQMTKDFQAETYIVDDQLQDTLAWLCQHQDSFDSFTYDAIEHVLTVFHANGQDVIKQGDFLNAKYGILITAHNFAKSQCIS